MFYSPLRYPGGKAFLASELGRIIEAIRKTKPTYIEPYAGGAGAALALLFSNKVKRIIINDYDKAIYYFWCAVTQKSKQFAKKIEATPVNIREWKKQRKIYLDENAKSFDKGFATFFLNRTNRSGVMNAWPIGGNDQKGNYKIDARYNKKELAERILKIGKYKGRITVLNEDGIVLTKKYLGRKNTFIYLDPPYFAKGAMLYLNYYNEGDHKKLAKLLNTKANCDWVLTYDIADEIKKLYLKRRTKLLELNYRVHDSSKATKTHELMVFSNTTSV